MKLRRPLRSVCLFNLFIWFIWSDSLLENYKMRILQMFHIFYLNNNWNDYYLNFWRPIPLSMKLIDWSSQLRHILALHLCWSRWWAAIESVWRKGTINHKSNYTVRLILMSLLNQSRPITVHHTADRDRPRERERERESADNHLLLKKNWIRGGWSPLTLADNMKQHHFFSLFCAGKGGERSAPLHRALTHHIWDHSLICLWLIKQLHDQRTPTPRFIFPRRDIVSPLWRLHVEKSSRRSLLWPQ